MAVNEDEVDYVECASCETPCYTFDLNAQGVIMTAICAECGNDDPLEFRVPGGGAAKEKDLKHLGKAKED
jgi:hypothetical protein